MDMLEKFFSVTYFGRSDLFEGLTIWDSESYRSLQGTWPVIFLTFANVKEQTWEGARTRIFQIIEEAYVKNRFLLESDCLSQEERRTFGRMNRDMSEQEATMAIHKLCGFLQRYYGKKVIVLLDEYDTPMQEALDLRRKRCLLPLMSTDFQIERYELELTNFEVKTMFRRMIRNWFGKTASAYNQFVKALLAGDVEEMNAYMNRIVPETFSYFDVGEEPSRMEPERFYHGFVLGLLVELNSSYLLLSNHEGGFGRYDVMLEPRNLSDDAMILEFKVIDPAREKGWRKQHSRH